MPCRPDPDASRPRGTSGITVTSTSLYKAYTKLTQSLYKASANTKLLQRLHYTKLVQSLHKAYTKLYTKLTPSLYQAYTKLIHSNQYTSTAFGQLGACKLYIVCVCAWPLSLPPSLSLSSVECFLIYLCFSCLCVCQCLCLFPCLFLYVSVSGPISAARIGLPHIGLGAKELSTGARRLAASGDFRDYGMQYKLRQSLYTIHTKLTPSLHKE